jgi:hypothetical protein
LANPAITEDSTRAASQLVLLQAPYDSIIEPGEDFGMQQLIPSTGLARTTYIVPAGQNLVLTGVELDILNEADGTYVILAHE